MAKKKATELVSLIQPPEEGPFKIQLACWSKPDEGFIGVDDNEQAEHFVILRSYPWPIADSVVDNLLCKNYLPKLPALERLTFLDECWRVLKPDGQLVLSVPARGANRAYMDPFFQYPPIVEDFFYFANKEWRETNGYSHYPVTCDFEWGYGFAVDEEIQFRNDELQRMAVKFLRNAAHEMMVTMTKRG